MAEMTPTLLVFNSASTVIGLDFMVRSLISIEANGTVLKPEDVTTVRTERHFYGASSVSPLSKACCNSCASQ